VPGDLLVLASDAAAASLLEPTTFTAALRAIRESLSAGESTTLQDWFRTIQAIQNDDVSMVAIRIPTAREVA
jgi:nicotinamide mononucleotide adenylyltransferase